MWQSLMRSQVPANWWQGASHRGMLFPKEVDDSFDGDGDGGDLTGYDNDYHGIGM